MKVLMIFFLCFSASSKGFSPYDLIGCFRTLEVSQRPVHFLKNKSLTIESNSFMALSIDYRVIPVIQMSIFKERHQDWDEWSVFEIFLHLGKWEAINSNKFRYEFKGRLRMRSLPTAILNYSSFLEVTALDKKMYYLSLGYSYTSTIGIGDDWAENFKVQRLNDNECI